MSTTVPAILPFSRKSRAAARRPCWSFVLTTTYAFIDWIMSLEPDWYSTIYGWLFTVGEVLLTFAFMIALLVLFSKHEPFASFLKIQHFHDLGNLMLCFTMLWAYMGLAQFLIIYAENLPDEIPWYIRRFSGGWGYLGWFLSIFHFCVPFFLAPDAFRQEKSPAPASAGHSGSSCVRMLDIFWFVAPAFRERKLEVYWTDLSVLIGMGGIWLAYFISNLKKRPLLVPNDPRNTYSVKGGMPTNMDHSTHSTSSSSPNGAGHEQSEVSVRFIVVSLLRSC